MGVRGKTLDLFPAQLPDEGAQPACHALAAASEKAPQPKITARQATAADPGRTAAQLWLALYFPHLPLEALGFCYRPLHGRSRPLIVAGPAGPLQRVVTCNAAALARGITPGLGINPACLLAHELEVVAQQQDKEREGLERLALWATAFTSRVSLEPPHALLLEIRGSLKLFGGLAALSGQVAAGIIGQGLTASLAVAPTPRSALWLARSGKEARVTAVQSLSGALAPLPLKVLHWADPVIQLLHSMGIQTLGDCLRLPRDGFARRLGPLLLLELDQAVGKAPEARRNFLPPVRFRATLDFEEDIEDGGRLLQKMDCLLEDLAEFLQARQAGIQALALDLLHRDQAPTRQIFRFAALATQRGDFLAVLREQLAQMVLPRPARGARLRSGAVLTSRTVSKRFSFVPHVPEPQQASRLLDKLRARLGEKSLYRLEVIADHRPEAAWRQVAAWQPASGSFSASHAPQEKKGERARPSWLLAQPEPLPEESGWPRYQGPLKVLQGPERIEGGWWDGRDVARDYYVAHACTGARLWIYRDRRAPHGWFLHGIFG